MCHQELWLTPAGHPFSFLNSFWGFTGGNYYQEITIAIFRFVLQNFTIPGYFPFILFYRYPFSLRLQVGLIFQYVALFQSKLVQYLESLYIDVELPSPMVSLLFGVCFLIFVYNYNIFFNTCIMCVIYVMEDNDSNV